MSEATAEKRVQSVIVGLGAAGLLPQAICVAGQVGGYEALPWPGVAVAYATIILSFLGGLWWGVALVRPVAAGRIPALLAGIAGALLPFALVTVYDGHVRGQLSAMGLLLFVSAGVDHLMARRRWVPDWWLSLRILLSTGLGALTIVMAAIA